MEKGIGYSTDHVLRTLAGNGAAAQGGKSEIELELDANGAPIDYLAATLKKIHEVCSGQGYTLRVKVNNVGWER